jgi:HEPN domain-containing protein
LPTPEEIKVADLFLSKAASDLAAAGSLARDPDQADDVVGFHAQQAVEKALKAVVALNWARDRVDASRPEAHSSPTTGG